MITADLVLATRPLERSTGILGGLYHLRQMLDMLAAVARDVKRTSEASNGG